MPIKTAYLIYRVCCFLVNKVSSAVKRPGIDKNSEVKYNKRECFTGVEYCLYM